MIRSILLLQFGQVLGRGLYLLFSFYYINRYLGVEAKGLWASLFAVFSILSAFSNLGFEVWLTREVAGANISRAQAWHFLIRAKGGLWLVTLGIGAVWAHHAKIPPALSLAFGLGLILEGVGLAQQAIFEGKRMAPAIALMSFIKSGGFALLALCAAPFAPRGLTVFAWLFALALLIRVIYGHRAWSLLPESSPNQNEVSWRGFLLMGSYTLVTIIYFKIDVVMLSALAGAQAAGHYDNAYLFVEGMTFVSAAVGTMLYPHLVQADGAAKARMFDALFTLVLTLGFCGALGIGLFGAPVGYWLIGPLFQGAEAPLAILVFALPVMFVNGLLNRWLFSDHREQFALITASAVALFNVGGNALMIPRYGIEGAALMTVLTEGVLLVIWLIWGRRSWKLGVTCLGEFLLLAAIFGLARHIEQSHWVLLTGLLFFTGVLLWRLRAFHKVPT